MTFVKRQLRFTFSYGSGPDGLGEPAVARVEGLRASARVVIAGGLSMGELQLRIYGMALSRMNQLSTLGVAITKTTRNTIIVEAGDVGGTLAKIYEGTIYSAWADMDAAPDVSFNVIANAGLFQTMATVDSGGATVTPSSFPVASDAAVILAGLAAKMGLGFENNGVSVILAPGAYYPGTLWIQAQACAQAANVEMIVDNGVMAIWPKGGNRSGTVALVAPETGMDGYPSYTAQGLMVRTIFTPQLRFGSLVQVRSDTLPVAQGQAVNAVGKQILPVDGRWKISTLTHDLAADYPGGPWFTDMLLTAPGLAVVGR